MLGFLKPRQIFSAPGELGPEVLKLEHYSTEVQIVTVEGLKTFRSCSASGSHKGSRCCGMLELEESWTSVPKKRARPVLVLGDGSTHLPQSSRSHPLASPSPPPSAAVLLQLE